MGQIKAMLEVPECPELELKYYKFCVIKYDDPALCPEHPDYGPDGRYENWMYINSAGYAQKYNPDKPPSKYPSGPSRLIVRPL